MPPRRLRYCNKIVLTHPRSGYCDVPPFHPLSPQATVTCSPPPPGHCNVFNSTLRKMKMMCVESFQMLRLLYKQAKQRKLTNASFLLLLPLPPDKDKNNNTVMCPPTPLECCDVCPPPLRCCEDVSLQPSVCSCVFSLRHRMMMMQCVLFPTWVAEQAATVQKVDQLAPPPPPEEDGHAVVEALHHHHHPALSLPCGCDLCDGQGRKVIVKCFPPLSHTQEVFPSTVASLLSILTSLFLLLLHRSPRPCYTFPSLPYSWLFSVHPPRPGLVVQCRDQSVRVRPGGCQ